MKTITLWSKAALVCFTTLALGCATSEPMDNVNPFVGTGFHGHTYPGATTPFGAVQLSPDTRTGDWDACAGYHYSDTTLMGFSHTHLSGTGCADLGDVLFRPTTRELHPSGERFSIAPCTFVHADEQAACGYYAVKLPTENLNVELTATSHTGLHRYTFTGGTHRAILIDLEHTLAQEELTAVDIAQTAPNEIAGMRNTNGWVADQAIYFVARFSEPILDTRRCGEQLLVSFSPNLQCLTVAVGLSNVCTENARENLLTEVPNLNFDTVRAQATAQWQSALSDIVVEGGSATDRANFYTAQYHTKLTPNLISDNNGQYRRHDGSIDTLPQGGKRYSTLSLWDTFRSWHPLQTLVNTQLVNDMICSMLDIYNTTGELPIWPLASGETRTMIGYHAVSVIADAYLKGIRNYDVQRAFEAMKRSSNINKKGAEYYIKYGFIPANICRESVSCLLEYAYDDWAIAQMAKALGQRADADEYTRRAQNYVHVFEGSTGFFRGKNLDGTWAEPFQEFHAGRDYTEATPWQYRFFVPHDVNGLIQLFGGRETFVQELDRLFTVESNEKIDLVDITGLIGQYAHGNEPSHHMAYLYNYVGQPWRTQQLTRRLLQEMYQPTPEGICGNEDCGQMSAWYVLSSLGFYPVCPGSNEFALTTPLFDKATIRLANDRVLTVTANNPQKNHYIKRLLLNGKEIDRNFITYDELMQGGTLSFTLGRAPDTERGTAPEAAPYSQTKGQVVSIPYTTSAITLFTEPVRVELGTTTTDAELHYTTDGTEPDQHSARYTTPLLLTQTTLLKAKGFKTGAAPSQTLTVKATKADFMAPTTAPTSLRHGTFYRYYQGTFARVEQITGGLPSGTGILPEPSITQTPQQDHYGYLFSGLLYIPQRGVWSFETRSDDGSVLRIGDRTVVDNDGSHAAVAATGRIALEQGYYPYTLLYFEDYEGQELQWRWKAPDAESFTAIPTNNLFIQ